MAWIIIFLLIVLITAWFLFSTLELNIDTRIPSVTFRLISIGKASVVFEDGEWWLMIRVFIFKKKWSLWHMIFEGRNKKSKANVRRKSTQWNFHRISFLKLLKTFRITQLQIAIDSDDVIKNALLYPLSFIQPFRNHLFVNFKDDNYLVITVRNAPWKIIYALIR
ncbi:hypothetical protein [Pedobacter immunditicola]|uniref:hypothetical protein n=1 Tax=Pedobacter immunditicola TaxID=3133440 RepID=UPI00309A96C5